MQAVTALKLLTINIYNLIFIKHTKSRAWTMQMRHFVKATIVDSDFNQLIAMWNSFDILFRRDIFMSESHTTLFSFLNALNSKISIWKEMADRRQHQQQQNRQSQYQRQQSFNKNVSFSSNIKSHSSKIITDEKNQVFLIEQIFENEVEGYVAYAQNDEWIMNEYFVN